MKLIVCLQKDVRRKVLSNCNTVEVREIGGPGKECTVYDNFPDYDYSSKTIPKWGLDAATTTSFYGQQYESYLHDRYNMHWRLGFPYVKFTEDNNGRIFKGRDATFTQGGAGRCVNGVCTLAGRSAPAHDGVSNCLLKSTYLYTNIYK